MVFAIGDVRFWVSVEWIIYAVGYLEACEHRKSFMKLLELNANDISKSGSGGCFVSGAGMLVAATTHQRNSLVTERKINEANHNGERRGS